MVLDFVIIFKDVGSRCNFFEWFDQDFSRRAFDVITHLHHRRIYLEEKLKLLEENLAENGEKKEDFERRCAWTDFGE